MSALIPLGENRDINLIHYSIFNMKLMVVVVVLHLQRES